MSINQDVKERLKQDSGLHIGYLNQINHLIATYQNCLANISDAKKIKLIEERIDNLHKTFIEVIELKN